MVNYKVEEGNPWQIVETQTGQVLKENLDREQAKNMCRHLNFGGGFDGNTPGFFLNKLEKFHFEDDYFYK
jgi:hypothetical protein